MKKRIILSLVLVTCLVVAFAGCNVPTFESYTIPMIDLEEGVIRSGDIDEVTIKGSDKKTDVLYTFGEDVLKNDMFAHKTIVADKDDFGKDYMAHPDSILLKRKAKDTNSYVFGEEILTMFPLAHGKGELKAKISYDGGMTYDAKDTLTNTPSSWKYSQETPTLYRLTFSADNVPDDNDLLVLTSGNPLWPGQPEYHANGFNVSVSAPSLDANGDMVEGRVWSQFETWYGRGDDTVKGGINRSPKGILKAADPIVAMSSLTRLKVQDYDEGGKLVGSRWTNKWMGLFHDHQFNLYKTILSFAEPKFDEAGYPTYPVPNDEGEVVPMVMHWSDPVVAEGDADYDSTIGDGMYFDDYKKTELKAQACEVECIRSDAGTGDRLALLMRSNSKKMYSLITFSDDEGKTWSEPRELPQALSGERHKAEWVKGPNGEDKLFITFRSIERSDKKVKKFVAGSSWMSEGYVAWVGSWDDLENGTEGDFRVKLAHTYLDKQTAPSRSANGDTGYCGNVVLPGGNKVATCSYGRFSPDKDAFHGGHTYIVGRVLDIAELYSFIDMMNNPPATPETPEA